MLPFKPWLVNHIVVGKAWETQLFTFELHFNFTGFSDEPLAKNTTSLPLLHVVLSSGPVARQAPPGADAGG